MIRMSVQVEGVAQLQLAMRKLGRDATIDLQGALDESANALRADIVESVLSGDKTGRVYGKREHRASAPGEAPANDTGNLVALMQGESGIDRSELGNLDIGIVSPAPYSEALEYKPSHAGGRPFMRPALERNSASIIARVRDAVARVVRRAGRR